MANKTQTIRIESIMGGESSFTNISLPNQYLNAINIDPSLPVSTTSGASINSIASGLLRPTSASALDSSTINDAPMWLVPEPKGSRVFIHDYVGSVYTTSNIGAGVTGISDGGNEGGQGRGNGCAYYDNYVYFAKNTTIARYGPLNGTASLNGDYWGTTLGKTALTDTEYPTNYILNKQYPNHILHRHSDGKLYILDVVDNQGTIHYIKTRKTTVEGDTDDGSTYDKVNVGYGLWPTAIESFGEQLVVSFSERTMTALNLTYAPLKAKVAFWDTTSEKVNQIVWVEYPDDWISGIKNVNGTLYFCSGTVGFTGFRVMRYVGGNSFEEVYNTEFGTTPYPGAVVSESNRLLFGSFTWSPTSAGCVYSLGLPKMQTGGVFKIQRTSSTVSSTTVTSIYPDRPYNSGYHSFYTGWSNGDGLGKNGIDLSSNTTLSTDAIWWSQIYNIGQPYKITKIRIPLAEELASGDNLSVALYQDNFSLYRSLGSISSTTHGTLTKSIVIRPQNATGYVNFSLQLYWSTNGIVTVALPITIEYELVDD